MFWNSESESQATQGHVKKKAFPCCSKFNAYYLLCCQDNSALNFFLCQLTDLKVTPPRLRLSKWAWPCHAQVYLQVQAKFECHSLKLNIKMFMIKFCVTLNEGQGNKIDAWCILMTKAVTLSDLIAITSLVSEISAGHGQDTHYFSTWPRLSLYSLCQPFQSQRL